MSGKWKTFPTKATSNDEILAQKVPTSENIMHNQYCTVHDIHVCMPIGCHPSRSCFLVENEALVVAAAKHKQKGQRHIYFVHNEHQCCAYYVCLYLQTLALLLWKGKVWQKAENWSTISTSTTIGNRTCPRTRRSQSK